MKRLHALVISTLALWALSEASEEWSYRELAAHDPPLVISPDEIKKFKLEKDKTAKNVNQPKDAGKLDQIKGQISGGTTAVRGQLPWQVYILADNVHLCGGALITSQYVLTAAHCVDGRTALSITFGSARRNVFEDGRIVVDTSVKFIHPNFSRTALNNDIAMIRLPFAIFSTATTNIRTVKLPATTDATKTFEGFSATASGWGRLSSAGTSNSNDLQLVNMTVISNAKCASIYNTTVITATSLCTDTTGGKSTCQGDSGGPLVYYDPGVKAYIVIGITSFTASQGCDKGFPATFTRVASYLAWISKTIAAPSSG